MDAAKLRQIFEKLDQALEYPTELLIRGGAAVLAHGLEQRVTIDIDVLPASRFIEADLRRACAAADLGFNQALELGRRQSLARLAQRLGLEMSLSYDPVPRRLLRPYELIGWRPPGSPNPPPHRSSPGGGGSARGAEAGELARNAKRRSAGAEGGSAEAESGRRRG
jgi:hypothetical protein